MVPDASTPLIAPKGLKGLLFNHVQSPFFWPQVVHVPASGDVKEKKTVIVMIPGMWHGAWYFKASEGRSFELRSLELTWRRRMAPPDGTTGPVYIVDFVVFRTRGHDIHFHHGAVPALRGLEDHPLLGCPARRPRQRPFSGFARTQLRQRPSEVRGYLDPQEVGSVWHRVPTDVLCTVHSIGFQALLSRPGAPKWDWHFYIRRVPHGMVLRMVSLGWLMCFLAGSLCKSFQSQRGRGTGDSFWLPFGARATRWDLGIASHVGKTE